MGCQKWHADNELVTFLLPKKTSQMSPVCPVVEKNIANAGKALPDLRLG